MQEGAWFKILHEEMLIFKSEAIKCLFLVKLLKWREHCQSLLHFVLLFAYNNIVILIYHKNISLTYHLYQRGLINLRSIRSFSFERPYNNINICLLQWKFSSEVSLSTSLEKLTLSYLDKEIDFGLCD